MQYKSLLDTDWGQVIIEADEEGILGIGGILEGKAQLDGYENIWTLRAKQELQEYFKGQRKQFNLPLKMIGTEFQKKVWNALLTIPYGECVSYKEICKKIGNEKACQAVGTAVGKNPFFIVVPCHRVISSDGTIGGYALGLEMKRKLFHIEGIQEKIVRGKTNDKL